MENSGPHLIVFDVEGVLLPKRRFLLFEVAARLGPFVFLRFLLIGTLYEIGLLSLEFTLKKLFTSLKGVPLNQLFSYYQRLPFNYGAAELFKQLRERGLSVALISSGIPRIFVEDLANRLGADHASGLEVGVSEGRLTGEIWGDVLNPDGKGVVLKRTLEKLNLSSDDCIVIADDRNNLPMFTLCKTRIGYNPDFLIRLKSDHVTADELPKIFPLLTGKTPSHDRRTLSQNGVLRELIHASGVAVPFVCMYILNDQIVLGLIAVATATYALSEVFRMLGKNLPIFSTITAWATERTELQEFAMGPIFYGLGILASLFFFDPPVSYAAIAILTVGDSAAAVFGRIFGRTPHPLNRGKRVEGSLIGLIFAFLASALFVDPARGFVGATVGMLAESLPSPVDDNIMLPLVSGLVLAMIV